MDLISTTVFLLAIIYLANEYFLRYWQRNGFKQLQPSFLVGNFGKAIRKKIPIGEYFEKLYKKTKENRIVGLYFLYSPILLVNDPLLVHDILIKDFNSFHDRPFQTDEKHDPLSGHLVFLTGKKWRNLRRKLTPVFTSSKVKGMFPIIKGCAGVLSDFMAKKINEGSVEFELKDLMARYTTNIISGTAFGIDNDCINDPDHIFRKMGTKVFAPTLKQSLKVIVFRFLPRLFKFLKLKYADDDVEAFIFSIVEQIIEIRKSNSFSRNDFMQQMIELKNHGFVSSEKDELDGETGAGCDVRKLSLAEVAAQAFIFFVAGYETSGSTLFFCLYELSKNQVIQRKVQQEIDEAFKALEPDEVNYEVINSLKYLDCCIDETLRKYPLLQVLTRKCTKNYNVPESDLMVSKGTLVYIPLLGLQRDPEIFENPLQFKPERFLNSPTGGGQSKGLFYLPFGDGPRACIGIRVGKLATQMGLALMLSKFNFELVDKSLVDKEIEFHPKQFVLTPAEEFMFKVSCR